VKFAPVQEPSWEVERVGYISHADFQAKYERNSPVVLPDLAAQWPAKSDWTIDYLDEVAGGSVVSASFPEQSEGWVNEIAHIDEFWLHVLSGMDRNTDTDFPKRLPKDVNKLRKRFKGKLMLVRPPQRSMRLADALRLLRNGRTDVPTYVDQAVIYEGLDRLGADLGPLDIHSGNRSIQKQLYLSNCVSLVGLHTDAWITS